MKNLFAIALLALLLTARVAIAQPAGEEQLINQGADQREAGHDEAALTLFRQAYEIAHSPRALAQMGLAEQALGRWVRAEAHLREAMAATHPWIVSNRAALEASFGVIQQRLGSLEVRGGVPGAEVIVSGVRAATLPMEYPIRVITGTVTFEVRAPGYVTVMRTAVITPGSLARESVDLVRVPSTAVAAVGGATASPTATTGAASTPGAPPGGLAAGGGAPRSGGSMRTLGWVAAAGALVFLGGGAALLGLREGQVSSYNQGIQDRHCWGTNAPAGSEPQDCQDYLSTGNTYQTLSTVGFIVGGVLAVGSVVLLLAAPSRSNEAPRSARLSCGSGPGELGVACGGVF